MLELQKAGAARNVPMVLVEGSRCTLVIGKCFGEIQHQLRSWKSGQGDAFSVASVAIPNVMVFFFSTCKIKQLD